MQSTKLLFAGAVLLALPGLAQTVQEPALPVLTLPQARELALENNLELRAAEANWRASQGAAKQAGSFLNPEIEFGREDFGGTLPMDQRAPQEAVSVIQTVRIGGKRRAEKAAAGWASETALADYRMLRLDLVAEVDRQFAELLGAQELERITAENLSTAREMARAVNALVEAGEVSSIEASRAQTEEDLADIDLKAAIRDVATARNRLAQTLGQGDARFGRAEGDLTAEVIIPEESAILRGLESLPDMARWTAETQRLEASLERAKREAIPDPTFSVGLRRYTTTQERAYFAGVAIPLPLFNRNRGGILEASSRLDQGRLELMAEEVRLHSAMASARLALDNSAGEVAALRDRVLPKAELVYLAVNEGYLRGKFRLLDLLEARRSLASTRQRHVESLVRLNVAKADMDRLLVASTSPSIGAKP